MKNTHTLSVLSLAALGSLISVTAFAQDDYSPSYAYGGIALGQSQARIDEPRISARLAAEGASRSGMTKNETDMVYKIFGGYQFNRNFAVEAGYFNLGKFDFNSTTVPAGTYNGQIKLQGANVDLVATLPLTQRWSALGRAGIQYANARDTFQSTGAVRIPNATPSKNAVNYKIGAGVQYEVNPSLFVRGEVEHLRVNDAIGNRGGVNMYTVSLVIPLGRTTTPAPRAVATPVYVAPAPEPVPVAVVVITPPPPVVVVAPVPRRVSFSADSLFAFDKSMVRPEGKMALDTFAGELKGTIYDVISVEGHTDRLGTAAYNEKLSAERADSVKSYLVSSGGVDSTKISATAKGETQPVTQADDCKGNKATAKLIACLQPDRRVVVEVIGTR
ncbi:MAG: OmpA family protein [Burkholderiaceae bacterium]